MKRARKRRLQGVSGKVEEIEKSTSKAEQERGQMKTTEMAGGGPVGNREFSQLEIEDAAEKGARVLGIKKIRWYEGEEEGMTIKERVRRMIRKVDARAADFIEDVFVTPRSKEVGKIFVAFYDKKFLDAVVSREHLLKSWHGNGSVSTCPWIGPPHFEDYQKLTRLDYKLRVCADHVNTEHDHRTTHKLCNEKIRTRIRYLGVRLVMDVRVVASRISLPVGAEETVDQVVDKLIVKNKRRYEGG